MRRVTPEELAILGPPTPQRTAEFSGFDAWRRQVSLYFRVIGGEWWCTGNTHPLLGLQALALGSTVERRDTVS